MTLTDLRKKVPKPKKEKPIDVDNEASKIDKPKLKKRKQISEAGPIKKKKKTIEEVPMTTEEPAPKKKKRKQSKKPKKTAKAVSSKDPIEEFYELWEEAASDPKNESYESPIPPAIQLRTEEEDREDFIVKEIGGETWSENCSKVTKNGKPLVCIISPGAVRCLDMKKILIPGKLGDVKSALLFSKHKKVSVKRRTPNMKIEEQAKFLESSKVIVVFGTPARIRALLEQNDLKFSSKTAIFIDWTHKDIKERRLCDMPEVKTETFKLLFQCSQHAAMKKIFLF